jgi:hypothetical protein
VDIGGLALLNRYNYSFMRLLSHLFPEHEWSREKFDKTNENYLDDLKNQRKFVEWAAIQLGILEMSDWNRVSYKVTYHL